MSRKKLGHHNSQAWYTAHKELKNRGKNIILHGSNDPLSLIDTQYKPGYIYTIEIEITDARGGEKKGYYIPRLFVHSFNVIIYDDCILLNQSWFGRMPYHRFLQFSSLLEFKGWMRDHLLKSIKNFIQSPSTLYKVFGHHGFHTFKDVKEYMKGTFGVIYRIDIYQGELK